MEELNSGDVEDSKKFWEELIAYFSLLRHVQHRKRHVQQSFYWCLCIRCRGNVFTNPLPSNDRGIHRLWEGFINYAVKMGSGAMIYTASFIKTGSGIQQLGNHRHTDSMVI
jgi:hypothetical protein